MLISPLRPVPAGPGSPYTVAAIVVQEGGGDAAELSLLATGLADEVRRLLSGRDPVATAAVAVAGPEPAAPALRVDRGTRHVAVGDRSLDLTYREFELLAFLVEHPGRVFSRRQLLSSVWGDAPVGSRTVDVHVRRLRVKLGAEAVRLRTVRNVGYRLDPEHPAPIARAV